MGFHGKAFDNGLQAKAAGSKPILFPANQNLGRSGRCIISMRSSLSIAHHHVVHIACSFTFRLWTNFLHFPPPPLPPVCELISSLFVFIVLVGGGFFPHLCWEILVYYILADLENKVRHLWWPNFLQPNPTLCLPSQQTSAPPRRALGHAKFPASLS